MTNPQDDLLRRLFDRAFELPVSARAVFVDSKCANDADLKRRLRAVLAAAGDSQFGEPPGDPALLADAHAPQANTPRPEGPGSTIGPYKLVQQIGEGGFGVVFLAEQVQPVARMVAVKIVKLGMDTHQVVARFEQERQALAVMDHPNIARVIDAGATATGRPYFVMELVKGVPIGEYCDKNSLTVDERLELFGQVCSAVQHAHHKGIIHRDLKPGNLLVAMHDSKPQVKVIDFGIAKATSQKLTDKTLLTEQEQVIGTLQYMSPEQAEGSLDIDTRTDVYALGVVLYELLTGSTPFDAKTLRGAMYSEIKRMIREVDPPRPSTRLSESHDTLPSLAAHRRIEPGRLGQLVRGELDWIVMKALEKDRARRYESASGLWLDIRRHLDGEAVTAAPPSAVYRVRKFVRRNRASVAGAAAVGLALLIGVVGFAWQGSIARGQRDRAMHAEEQTAKRAAELQKVADYQSTMLQQVDAREAGVRLLADLRSRHAAALGKGKVPEAEMVARTEAFESELHTVNATDAAVALLDSTVLAPAVLALDAQFADQPLVDASLRTTLAVVYHALGRPEQALALYERARSLRVAILGEEHRDTLASRYGVGRAQGELQQLTEAESTVRATLAGYERALGENHVETLTTKGLLASQMYYQGKYEECEAITRDVIARRIAVLGSDHPDTLNTRNDLGRILVQLGKYAAAVVELRTVVEVQRRVADRAVAATLSNLGNALVRQREFAAAEPYLREALARDRRERGEDHPHTLAAIDNLAAVLMDMGKLAEAEPLAREALEKCRRIHGSEFVQTLKAMNVMGLVLLRQGKFDETEVFYREALATGRRVLGEEHPDTIVWIANMAALHKQRGRVEEAESLYREAMEKSHRQLGEDHPYSVSIMRSLTDLLRRRGKSAEVEGYYRSTLAAVRARRGADAPEMTPLLGLLGGLLRDEGKLEEAELLFEEALMTSRRLHGDDHEATLLAILRMASLRIVQGKHTEALALLAPIAGKIPRVIPGVTGFLRQASLLGLTGKARTALASQSADYAVAEQNLLEAHAVFARHRGETDKETREWAEALAALYLAWDEVAPGQGYDEKSAQWQK